MTKETKYFCDGKDCNKELLVTDIYYIVTTETHSAGMRYSGIAPTNQHYCRECHK